MSSATLRMLEGRQVSLTLRDGSQIHDSELVSAGRATRTLWLVTAGDDDVFVPVEDIVDIRERDTNQAA